MRLQLILTLLALCMAGVALAGGYQRSRQSQMPATGWGNGWGGHGSHHHWKGGSHFGPRVVAGSHFQRPYPYHLDYYRVRYGGSYAPYFGNMYGVPQVVAPFYMVPPYPYDQGFASPQLVAPYETPQP